MDNYIIESWFPSDILISKVSNDVLKIAQEEFVLSGDAIKTIYKENNGIRNGATTYNRTIAIPLVDNTQILIDTILDTCAILAKKQGVNLEKSTLEITSIWLNRLSKDGSHNKHAHGGVHYSGTLYVNIPKGSSNIRFYNPHTDLMCLSAVPVENEGDPATSLYVDFSPEPGKMLIWNSYLYHEVLQNPNKEYRDTISFNITVK